MKYNQILLLGGVALLTASCSSSLGGPNQTAGTLIGGVGGGLIGSQFGHGAAGPIIGTLGGAVAGSALGKYLDEKNH